VVENQESIRKKDFDNVVSRENLKLTWVSIEIIN